MHRDPVITPPITEFDLHAWLDGQLDPRRRRQVTRYLDAHPDAAQRVAAWRTQQARIRAWTAAVNEEPLPARLTAAACGRLNPTDAASASDTRNARHAARRAFLNRRTMARWLRHGRRVMAGVALSLMGVAVGWTLREGLTPATAPVDASFVAAQTPLMIGAGFAQRAAMAHAIYASDVRRPVEVDAAHEAQLFAWLSNRMGAPIRAPQLQSVGYVLEGGRLLPGRMGPVAQFMYRDARGQRLTLYVSNRMTQELAAQADRAGNHATPASPIMQAISGATRPDAAPPDIAFHFLEHEGLNVFYWIDGPYGYALSTAGGRAQLVQVSSQVYRQLARSSPP